MSALEALLRDLQRALKTRDEGQVASVRRTLFEGFPTDKAGAEAGYKLGLYLLFREQQLNQAAEVFRGTAKSKQAPWALMARTSLGQVLLTQGKFQQACFELRKAANGGPHMLTAQAKGLLVLALKEAGNGNEAERVREEHLALLDQIGKREGPEGAHARFFLGMEYKHDGRRREAKSMLSSALGNPRLPKDAQAAAKAALETL